MSEDRIVFTDDIKLIQELILCGICLQVVTEARIPVECNSCHNSIFCSACIKTWTHQNSSCPFCHKYEAEFVEISSVFM